MKVRVIAGRYGGRWLDAPDNRRTHPMGERVRNALFNSLGDAVQDARVLDAFAGTGAVGLEALIHPLLQSKLASAHGLALTMAKRSISSLPTRHTTISSLQQLADFLPFSNQADLWYYHIQE